MSANSYFKRCKYNISLYIKLINSQDFTLQLQKISILNLFQMHHGSQQKTVHHNSSTFLEHKISTFEWFLKDRMTC